MLNDYGDILTLNELCEVLKISENVAYRLIREKSISAFKVGRIYKIPKKAVESYILAAANMK
ncbi:helix-turn-helix domain-containing protein [Lacrimispora sphenoides]|uniref:DNA binding domain-containing protein, excisionase family n=1 Tax=Lacrimispora sphenoides JCM 1415 TaxID=1297793 RepID=A0ABY1C260_9FIRM|nr:helix-turn-helix domain-containing protein [Lacrimispora sphenoides]SET55559.1 DNA binding domain-containing protein, excisionase family [[Clostridium] sphenoides JCM 1415]SUY49734.1 DNA binding domain-containing protein [Lacrimispora sphenoides]